MDIRFYLSLFFIVSFSIFMVSCSKEKKEIERNYPRVATGLVTNVNMDGATFNGSFLQTGGAEIIDHGFAFGVFSSPTILNGEKLSLGSSTGSGSFTARANYAFTTNETYYVSAYARNKDKIFYSQSVSFVNKGGKSP